MSRRTPQIQRLARPKNASSSRTKQHQRNPPVPKSKGLALVHHLEAPILLPAVLLNILHHTPYLARHHLPASNAQARLSPQTPAVMSPQRARRRKRISISRPPNPASKSLPALPPLLYPQGRHHSLNSTVFRLPPSLPNVVAPAPAAIARVQPAAQAPAVKCPMAAANALNSSSLTRVALPAGLQSAVALTALALNLKPIVAQT